ncbi:MAG TPA: iron-containing alcohol dehydrogenase, partial [Anaerolineae bacterium]|nr:iron-containing alcohol dehydrogenase [Anaerolineae bacterium]
MWYFVSPEIIFGEGALEALDELAGRRALIVTDHTLAGMGLVERVESHLRRAGFEIHVFDEVEPEPSVETVQRGAQVAADF